MQRAFSLPSFFAFFWKIVAKELRQRRHFAYKGIEERFAALDADGRF
jgi:hypothetical protein